MPRRNCSTSGVTTNGWRCWPRTSATGCRCGATSNTATPPANSPARREDISWFDEGKDTLTRRVRQIQTGIHWAEEPQSRITHMVSNVQLLEATPDAGMPREVTAKCRFLIYRNRVETETDLLVGKREDTLRRAGDGWLIARRKIILDQNVLLTKNLTFFF